MSTRKSRNHKYPTHHDANLLTSCMAPLRRLGGKKQDQSHESGPGSLSESMQNGCCLLSTVLRDAAMTGIPLDMHPLSTGLLASVHITMDKFIGAQSISAEPHR
jgi:hypothetical protein